MGVKEGTFEELAGETGLGVKLKLGAEMELLVLLAVEFSDKFLIELKMSLGECELLVDELLLLLLLVLLAPTPPPPPPPVPPVPPVANGGC